MAASPNASGDLITRRSRVRIPPPTQGQPRSGGVFSSAPTGLRIGWSAAISTCTEYAPSEATSLEPVRVEATGRDRIIQEDEPDRPSVGGRESHIGPCVFLKSEVRRASASRRRRDEARPLFRPQTCTRRPCLLCHATWPLTCVRRPLITQNNGPTGSVSRWSSHGLSCAPAPLVHAYLTPASALAAADKQRSAAIL
jgi:hypothetical protein